MAQKYFWLKLQKDFFQQRCIKKLRRMAGGDTYTIICLEMYLLSLENEGIIIHEGVEETIEEEIALALDETAEDVKMTFLYLQSQQLIEPLSDTEFLLPAAAQSVGSETQAAERMRRHREKNKTSQSYALPSHCNSDVQNRYVEKRRDREETREYKDEEKNAREISSSSSAVDFFKTNINSAPPQLVLDELRGFAQTMSDELMIHAMQIAMGENKSAWSYIRGILQNWQRAGYSCVADMSSGEKRRSSETEDSIAWMRDFVGGEPDA
jgi:DnaD and phage-associated domain/phage replisome organizer, putative, N-terminal region